MERLVFRDEGRHPIFDNVNLLGNGLVLEVTDSPLGDNFLVQEVPDNLLLEEMGHNLSMKANVRDMSVTDGLLRNEI